MRPSRFPFTIRRMVVAITVISIAMAAITQLMRIIYEGIGC